LADWKGKRMAEKRVGTTAAQKDFGMDGKKAGGRVGWWALQLADKRAGRKAEDSAGQMDD
jgi:hypothetical protein